MDVTMILQAAKALSLDDRLELLFQLWDQTLDEGESEIQEKLDQRWANFKANPSSGLSWDQVVASLQEK